jgi:hypothetical protein
MTPTNPRTPAIEIAPSPPSPSPAVQRPGRRLRQLNAVSARGLPEEAAAGGAFFALFIPCDDSQPAGPSQPQQGRQQERGRERWRCVYCSEAVYGTRRPDWEPMGSQFSDAPPEVANAARLVLTVHLVPAPGDAAAAAAAAADALRRPAAAAEGAELTLPRAGEGRDSHIADLGCESEAEPSSAAGLDASCSCSPPAANGAAQPEAAAEDVLSDQIARQLVVAALPGTLCAAWRLRLREMHPAGQEPAAAAALLEFADGQCYSTAPPPVTPQRQRQRQQHMVAPSEAATPAGGSPQRSPTAADASPPPPTTSLAGEGAATPTDGSANASPAAAAADAGATASSQGLGGMLLSKLLLRSAPGAPAPASAPATPPNGAALAAGGEAPAAAGAAVEAGAAALALPVTVAELRRQVAALAALRRRLQAARAECSRLDADVTGALARRERACRPAAELQALHEQAAEARRLSAVARRRLEAARRGADAARRAAAVRAQALAVTLRALQAADRRVREARESLEGQEGAGRLRAALQELVPRRCALVAAAAGVYRLGPTAVRVLRPPPGGLLDAQLDAAWAGAAGADAGDALLLPPPSPGGGGAAAASTAAAPSALFRQEVHLSIGGLELDASTWRKAFESDGYEWDAGEDRAAAVALGQAAHLADRIAAYCEVQLRYPLICRGSTSAVLDNYPPSGAWTEEKQRAESELASSRGGAGGGAGAGGVASFLFGLGGGGNGGDVRAGAVPAQYPLHCASNRDRPRFAVGVFLLNKDVIQLLQAHGVTAAGPNQLLQNLHKLVACAQACLPPGGGGSGSGGAV